LEAAPKSGLPLTARCRCRMVRVQAPPAGDPAAGQRSVEGSNAGEC